MTNPVLENIRRSVARTPQTPLSLRPDILKPRLPESADSETERFLSEVNKLSGKAERLEPSNILSALQSLVAEQNIRKATVWNTPRLNQLQITTHLSSLGVELISPNSDKHTIAQCDLGITEADYLLPETGTLVLRSSAEKPRAVSLAPRVHLALVHPSMLRPDMHQVFAEAKDSHYLVFITGPSRTADIELTVTLGVHGPKNLYVDHGYLRRITQFSARLPRKTFTTLDEVEFLLTRLFGGRKPASEQLERVKDRYRLIGGCSPLPQVTSDQAVALEKELHARGYALKSYVGMRYCHPLIEETLRQIVRDGFKEIVAVPMAPFRSRASTGAYSEELNRLKGEGGAEIRVFFVEGWYRHPLFLKAIQEKIEEGLRQFAPEERRRIHLIFTAHSLPKSLISNDPYVAEIEESVAEVLKGLRPMPWRIAFQSKGAGPGEWIGPEVERVLEDLASQKVKEVLVVPIGFVSDHIEILYDIDIVYRKKAESLGMKLKRTPSLHASESFVKALSTIVEEHLKGF